MGNIIGNTACSSCRKLCRDKTGNHLILFEDGGAYCNRCGYRESKNTYTPPSVDIRGELSPEEIQKRVSWVNDNSTILGMKSRQLKQFVCQHFGVRTGLSLTDGTTPVMTYIPIRNEQGDLTGYKCKTPEKSIWIEGSGKNAAMFGADKCPVKGNKIFVTEGQEDAMALYQIMYEHIDPKYRKRIAVVSLQNGAGSADKEFVRNVRLFQGYKEVVLCFDMDEAGRQAVEKVVSVLPREKIRVAEYDEKDANDMLKAGKGKELYFNVLEAREPKPEKIVSGTEFSLKSLKTPLRPGITTPYHGLDSKLRGFRYGEGGGELTVICAAPGFGKTTLARELNYHFTANHGLNMGNIFLEENKNKTAQGLIAIDNNVPLSALRQDPSMLGDKFDESFNKLINNNRYHALNHWGSLASNDLMEHMWYFSKVLRCDFIFLDHISLVVSGQTASSEGERRDLDILMTKLAAFTEESGTSVVSVVHLKRPDNGSFNEGKQVSLQHLRGSAAIEQLSHNIIAIEGDQQGDNPNGRILRVLKNREWGDIGMCENLIYHPETGRLLLADQTSTAGIRNAGH